MLAPAYSTDTKRYAHCINVSRRVRWDIDKDVIRGRRFDYPQKFLPNGLSLVNQLDFLTVEEMPQGYAFLPDPNEVASVVLGKST